MIHFVWKKFRTTPDMFVEQLRAKSLSARAIRLAEGRKLRTSDGDLVINWGVAPFETTTPVKTLNNQQKLGKASVLDRLVANNLPVPKWQTCSFAPNNEDYPVLLRKNNGYGGSDIIFCEDEESFLNNRMTRDFWTKYIDKKYEFRLHIFGGDVIQITRKVAESEEAEEHVAWNHTYGFRQVTYRNAFVEMALTNIGKQIYEIFDYDFFTVDVIADDVGNFYILELNTASGITAENRVDLYLDKFMEVIWGLDTP